MQLAQHVSQNLKQLRLDIENTIVKHRLWIEWNIFLVLNFFTLIQGFSKYYVFTKGTNG